MIVTCKVSVPVFEQTSNKMIENSYLSSYPGQQLLAAKIPIASRRLRDLSGPRGDENWGSRRSLLKLFGRSRNQ